MADPGVGSWNPINIFAMLRALVNNGVPFLTVAGAPTSGTSGSYAGQGGPGALLIDYTNGILYQNTNTLASPTWTRASLGAGTVGDTQLVGTVNFGISALRVAHAIYDFSIDGGAIGAITPANTVALPSNAILVGGTINSTTAVTSAGAATVSIGTTTGSGAASILGVTAKATLSVDALINAAVTFAAPVKMSSNGSINITVAAAALTAGIIEIFVVYYVTSNV